jgi:hypothetical protein
MLCFLGSWACAAEPDAHRPETFGPQPASGYEHLRDFPHSSKFFQAGTLVGYLYTELQSGAHTECTGMVVSSHLVLSARHCIWDDHGNPLHIKSIRFWLGDTHTDGGTPYVLDKTPSEIGAGKARDTDYVVFNSLTAFKLDEIRIPPLGADPVPDQILYVYHEPYGQPLTLTRFKCQATEDKPVPGTALVKDSLLRHTCDTQSGSSGGMILNEDLEIVGMHLYGGRSEKENSFNEGLLMSRIVSLSPVLKGAFTHGVGTVPHVPEAAVSATTARRSYKRAGGEQLDFIRADEKWFLVRAADNGNARTPLKVQGQADHVVVLWEPGTDTYYDIPEGGGVARLRPASDGLSEEMAPVSE